MDFPGIPQVLEVWLSHCPLSSAFRDLVGDKPSTSDSTIHGKKGKVKFPYILYEGNYPIHLCPYLDEAPKVLENLRASQPWISFGCWKISPNPPLVDKVIDLNPSSFNLTLSKHESYEYVPNQSLLRNWLTQLHLQLIALFPLRVKFIPLSFFLFIQILSNKGTFILLYQNPILVMTHLA